MSLYNIIGSGGGVCSDQLNCKQLTKISGSELPTIGFSLRWQFNLYFTIAWCNFFSLQHKAEADGGSVVGIEEVANDDVIALVDQAVVAILTRLHSECRSLHM